MFCHFSSSSMNLPTLVPLFLHMAGQVIEKTMDKSALEILGSFEGDIYPQQAWRAPCPSDKKNLHSYIFASDPCNFWELFGLYTPERQLCRSFDMNGKLSYMQSSNRSRQRKTEAEGVPIPRPNATIFTPRRFGVCLC